MIGKSPVLLEALRRLLCTGPEVVESASLGGSGGGDKLDDGPGGDKSREASGGDSVMNAAVVEGVEAVADEVTGSVSHITEASDPGNPARLSAELSVFIGRGGTIGGASLNGSDSACAAAVGESCSLEREYLRKWPPPVVERPGAKLALALAVAGLW